MAKKRQLRQIDRAPESGTLGELVEFLLGRHWRKRPADNFLGWPPDTFGIAATLLRDSGAYVNVLKEWPLPQKRFPNLPSYVQRVKELGRQWARQLLPPDFAPFKPVADLWREVFDQRDRRLTNCHDAWIPLVQLCALADEASERLAIMRSEEPASGEEPFELRAGDGDTSEDVPVIPWVVKQWMMDNVADENFDFSNLCSAAVSRSNVTVLPKMRTPQSGITIRSLSHNLALLPHAEVRARWQFSKLGEAEANRFREGMNLLVFPWPLTVHPIQFRPEPALPHRRLAERFRFFGFDLQPNAEATVAQVSLAYDAAQQRFGRIDGVIFPEMALDADSFDAIVQSVARKDAALVIGGVYERRGDGELAKNAAKIACLVASSETRKDWYEREQCKHHRWKLDGSQIRTYGLGSMLNPRYDWWEHIEVGERKLEFLQLDRSFAVAVLICEDLARPDPVGDVIRAVGPNLVLALLQDGPQLTSRWSARYATVLADDPGCSVLTLTGLGMTQLSRPANVKAPSRVVALWKQADNAAREIELPLGAEALVLCLSHEPCGQWTADGRRDGGNAGRVTLSGIHAVMLP